MEPVIKNFLNKLELDLAGKTLLSSEAEQAINLIKRRIVKNRVMPPDCEEYTPVEIAGLLATK